LSALISTRGAGAIAGVASAHATNEDLFAFRRFLEAIGSPHSGVAIPRGRADALLIKEEKAANGAGARALGFADAKGVVEEIRGGSVAGLVVLGHDLLGPGYLDDPELLAGLDTVVLIDTHRSPLTDVAHVVVPARHAAEKHGTLTQHAGRVQRVRPAVEPTFEALDEGEAVWCIGRALSLPGFAGPYDVVQVSKALSESVPAFEGIHLDSVDPAGRPLGGGSGS